MSHHDTNSPNHQSRQRGTVLIVALLLLLVMTILGLTAMNSSILQGLMATSYQAQAATLAQTENLLSELEQRILEGVAGTDYTVDYCPGVTRPAVDNRAWTGVPDRTLAGGRYTVEYLGRRLLPGESEAVGDEDEPPKYEYFLRPTARFEGDRDSLRIIQSVVAIGTNPGACP